MVVSVCIAYAWFAKNENVDSNGLQINTKYETMNAKYFSFYINNLDEKKVVTGSQYQNQQGQTLLDIRLLPYDMTFTSTNQYAPVVVRVQIYDIPANLIPAANQSKYVSLVISRDTSVSFSTNSELDGYFSSVGQIGCYTNSTLNLDDDEEDIYAAIIAQYRADQNVMKFTSQNNSTYTKVGFLDKSLTYTSANFKTDEENKSCLVLYMCFDYNATLSQAYAEQETGDLGNTNSLEHSFEMLNDIAAISVDFN